MEPHVWLRSFRGVLSDTCTRSSPGSRCGVRRQSPRYRPAAEPLEDRTLLSAVPLKDLNLNTVGSGPAGLTAVGAVLVRDIHPPGAGSGPTSLADVSGTL